MKIIQNKKLLISNSSINVFRNCKRRFRYKYIDRIASVPIKNRFLSFGSSIHSTLAEYNAIPPESQNLEYLKSILQKRWIPDGYESREIERLNYEKAKDMLQKYSDDKKDSGRIILCEEMIKHDVNSSLTLCGKVDKVYINPENKLELLDYKTGETFNPVIDIENDMQLPIYLLLLRYKLNTFPNIISYYYLSINNKVSLEVTQELIEYCVSQLKKIIQTIYNETQFPFSRSTRCKTNCEFYGCCEAMCGECSNLVINQ